MLRILYAAASILMLSTLGEEAYAQVPGLQAENVPVALAGSAGLPMQQKGPASVWGGYATTDSLKFINLEGSFGVGLANGSAFDLGLAFRIKAFTFSAWTSGLGYHLKDSLYPVSVLQRSSNFGVQYQKGKWAFAGGFGTRYISFNKDLEATQITPTVSAEYALKNIRVGARFSNFLFMNGQKEGRVGDPLDSTIVDPKFSGSYKGTGSLLLYGNGRFALTRNFYVMPALGIGSAFQTSKEFLAVGSSSSGLQAQAAVALAYKDRISANAGYRVGNSSKLSQLTWGLQLNIQQLSLFYSSYNFEYFGQHRAHQIGAAVAID